MGLKNWRVFCKDKRKVKTKKNQTGDKYETNSKTKQ